MNRTEKVSVICVCLSLFSIGIAIWRITHPATESFTIRYVIERELSFTEPWFNFTIHFIELPTKGLTVTGYKLENEHQTFDHQTIDNLTLYSGDTLTLNNHLQNGTDYSAIHWLCSLDTNELGVVTIHITH